MPQRPDQRAKPGIPLSPGGVSIAQLAAQGLMKDTTGQAINSNTGDALTQGVPPGVPNVASAKHLFGNYTGSPYTLITFTAPTRIWAASLSFAVSTNNSFSGATTNIYAQLITLSGITLEIVELSITSMNQSADQHGDLPLNGLSFAAGDGVLLDVNNATGVTNAVMRSSGFILYSTP